LSTNGLNLTSQNSNQVPSFIDVTVTEAMIFLACMLQSSQ